MSLKKLEIYALRYEMLRSSMTEEVKELMGYCKTLSDAYNILEFEIYKDAPTDEQKEFCWEVISTLDKYRLLKQKVKIGMDTLILINDRIKKMAKPYGLEDLLGVTLNDYFLNETTKMLADEETDRDLRKRITEIYESLE